MRPSGPWDKAIIAALACIAPLCDAGASAQTPTFKIVQAFSNIDGSIQYVRLTETEGQDGQHHFAGLSLRSTHNGVTKEYRFGSDLPTEHTAHLSIVVAASTYGKLPVAVGGTSVNDAFAYNCCYVPDYADLPVRFLPTDGGTLDFAGSDQFVYSSLPTDGITSLSTDGGTGRATLPGNGRCYQAVGCRNEFDIAQAYLFAVEYYNGALDHYFLSAFAPDIDALDTGRIPGWERTGQQFFIAGTPGGYPGLTTPVCRYYLPPARGNSHFLSASQSECGFVADAYPDFVKETDAAFYVALPDSRSGACPPDQDINGLDFLVPMYRLWNGRVDSNHRYTTDPVIRDAMLARGYIAEGVGPDSVAMCVP